LPLRSALVELARTRDGGAELVNFCANNYLGLADHPEGLAAAHAALDEWGFGLASVRFICRTQQLHKQLEARLSEFRGTEDTILYGSCFDANGGLFETLLGPDDVVIGDALNHASIIDGTRLCKARRLRYANGDMNELEERLRDASGPRRILIATDGVFSMDGYLARLDRIVELAETHDALVMVDDSHAVGVIGPNGRGTPEHFELTGRIDIVTGTFGKALGGASGGYTSGRREIIELLCQRARPYPFSNTIPPPVVAASLKVLDLLETSADRRSRLHANTALSREGMTAADAPGRAPDRPGDVWRPRTRSPRGRPSARRGHLRDPVFLPVSALGPGAHPHPALGRPHLG
jgi:glycine C-acetyltransferase